MPIVLGLFLGVANVVAIAVMIATMDGTGFAYGKFDLVFAFGIFPGVITGAALGVVAGLTRRLPAWARGLFLIEPAILVLFGLASWFGMDSLVPSAAVPTVIGCLILERVTRLRVADSPLPVAVVHR